MSREKKLAFKLWRPAGFDEAKIQSLIGPVDFIADNRVTGGREVHPNLMCAAAKGNRTNDAEALTSGSCTPKPPLDTEQR